MADTNNEATSPAPAALVVHGIPVGVPVPVDAELDPDSDNPVNNKAVCSAFASKVHGQSIKNYQFGRVPSVNADIIDIVEADNGIHRIAIFDAGAYALQHIDANGQMQSSRFINFNPEKADVALLNGGTTGEPANTGYIDYGNAIQVSLSAYTSPQGGHILSIPRNAKMRSQYTTPNGAIFYIDQNSTSLMLTGPVTGIYMTLVIPV